MSTSATALSRRSTLASVPTTSTSKPGTPRSRISSSVWVTPCMPPTASATSATRSGSPSRWTSLPFSRPRKAAAGAYGMAATQASKRPAAAAPRSPPLVVAARTPSTAPASLRSCARRARRKRSAWLKSSCCRSASRSPSPRRRSMASSQACSSPRASSGPRSAPTAPRRTSPSRMTRSTMVRTARGSTGAALAAPQRADGQRHRAVRPLGGAALVAARGRAAGAHVRRAARARCGRPGSR